MTNKSLNSSKDVLSVGLKIISFLIPIVGVIFYFVYKSKHPEKAKTAGKFALYGAGVALVMQIIIGMLN